MREKAEGMQSYLYLSKIFARKEEVDEKISEKSFELKEIIKKEKQNIISMLNPKIETKSELKFVKEQLSNTASRSDVTQFKNSFNEYKQEHKLDDEKALNKIRNKYTNLLEGKLDKVETKNFVQKSKYYDLKQKFKKLTELMEKNINSIKSPIIEKYEIEKAVHINLLTEKQRIPCNS